jgi:hypothetical protein
MPENNGTPEGTASGCPGRVLIIARMAYMLLIVEDPAQRGTRSEAEGRRVFQQMVDWSQDLKKRGVLRAVESLASAGARVQVRGGHSRLIDGPFAEAKEMVGGFFLVDVPTREQALALARECPAAAWATVEVRETGPCYL